MKKSVNGKATTGSARRRREAIAAASGVVRERAEARKDMPTVLPKGRKGQKAIAIYMHPVAKDLLVKIAHGQSKTIQDLGIEALNLLFRHYDEKPIA
jgi:Antitoxin-like ribbon-helix-helix